MTFLKQNYAANPFSPLKAFFFPNSHDSHLQLTGNRKGGTVTEHVTSRDDAGLVPKWHQTVSSPEQECVAPASTEHSTSIRVAPQPDQCSVPC